MTDTKSEEWKKKPWRNWVWTLHNPTDAEITHIQSFDATTCKCIIYGHELTKEGVPHLQGYIELEGSPKRFTALKALFDPVKCKMSKQFRLNCHPRAAKATRTDNIRYCSKGLQSHEEYEQLGENGPNYGKDAKVYKQIFKEEHEGQGKRNDWNEIYDSIKETPDFADILEKFPEYAMTYPHGIQKAIDTVINSKNKERLFEEMNSLKLFTWEEKLLTELKSVPDRRKIIWYVDLIGGSGKSTFAKYLLAKGDCAYFTNCKSADIAHAYKGERTVIFDFTRSVEGRINYEIIESIKNGVVFSGKYNSGLKVHATPHIICFSNFNPELNKLSQDRWDLRNLSPEDKQYPIETTIADTKETPSQYDGPLLDNIAEDDETCIEPMQIDNEPVIDTSSESRGNTGTSPSLDLSNTQQYRPTGQTNKNKIKWIETRVEKALFDAEIESNYSEQMLNI